MSAPALSSGATLFAASDEIDIQITRYRRIRDSIPDQQMRDAVERLVAELEAKKLALHPRGSETPA